MTESSYTNAQVTQCGTNVFASECPSRKLLDIIANKWTALVMHALKQGTKRNSELLHAIQGISQKMLTQTLRELQENGLVIRRDHGEVPPHVDYTLTPLGHSLAEIFQALDAWVETHFHEIEAARRAYTAS